MMKNDHTSYRAVYKNETTITQRLCQRLGSKINYAFQ